MRQVKLGLALVTLVLVVLVWAAVLPETFLLLCVFLLAVALLI